MELTMSRLLIEATVRQTLKGLPADPKRSVRNLLDMALQFSERRFQNDFLETARAMLENGNSAYYALVQDAVAHIETEHLIQFGMNVGYNSCTWGARRIRANEKRLGFNIPWTVLLCPEGPRCRERYGKVITEGEGLGIHTWMLFVRETAPRKWLPLVREHPDSAFFLFCPPGTVDADFAQAADGVYNLMPVVYLEDGAGEACALLRARRLPFSVWTRYAQEEADAITSGALFDAAQHLHPVFTALMPRADCRSETCTAVSEAVAQVRSGQCCATVPWELYTDTCRLDEVISDDACWAFFDGEGQLHLPGGLRQQGDASLFSGGLTEALRQAYPKTTALRSC